MISNLIQPPKFKNETTPPIETVHDTSAAVQNCARLFVGGMGDAQRERFKIMLQHGAECGRSIAQAYGIPLDDFILEVRKII